MNDDRHEELRRLYEEARRKQEERLRRLANETKPTYTAIEDDHLEGCWCARCRPLPAEEQEILDRTVPSPYQATLPPITHVTDADVDETIRQAERWLNP